MRNQGVWKVKRKKGSITVFMALLLGVLLLLLFACMESARMASARSQILCGAEIGLYSLFGQFDRELLDKFDLFALDAGRGSGEPDMACVYNVFRKYMDPVLAQNSPSLECLSGGFTGYRFLTDENGEGFFRQAVESVRKGEVQRTVLPFTASEIRALEASGRKERPAGGSRLHPLADSLPPTAGRICSLLRLAGQVEEEGILSFLPERVLSAASGSVAESSLLSRRSRHQGLPILDSLTTDPSGESSGYLARYEMDKLGNALFPSDAVLRLQAEYVLKGNASDRENLRETAEDLFAFRLGAGLEALRSSGSARAKAAEMAEEALASDELTAEEPPTADPADLEEAILYGWALLEAVSDVRILYEGGKIPVRKTTDTFNSAPDRPGIGTGGAAAISGQGFGYADYLTCRLKETSRTDLIWRGMDMIEWSVRGMGRSGFCLDSCLTAAEVCVQVRANGKMTFSLIRAYGYE